MVTFTQSFWTVYRCLLDLVFPPSCIHCGRLGTWLCRACAEQFSFWEGPFCILCGRPWDEPGPCRVCQAHSLHVYPIRSVFVFEGSVRAAVHALKYRGAASVASTLAAPMACYWQHQHMQGDCLVPVPLHPKRVAKRGYNQAELLARALGQHLDLPIVPHLLRRVRDTVSQTKLNRDERQKNMEGAFALAEEVDLSGWKLTLVDDVATTGSTLDACAEILLEAGAQMVNAFTLARAA